MLTYHKGNLFSVNPTHILHGCNCQGVMGAGFARQIRQKYPTVFEEYRKYCISRPPKDLLGDALVCNVDGVSIINAFTQLTCGNLPDYRYVSYDAVARVFESITIFIPDGSVYLDMPKICAGLGGADWNVIEAIIKSEVPDWVNIRVWEL